MSAGAGALPFVSVVVPTMDRAALLDDCLETLRRQDYPQEAYEVIVVHNGAAADRARFEDESAPVVRHLTKAVADANAARNLGISAARGELICLVDDDVLAPPEWLGAVVDGLHRHPGAACVGGPVRPEYERTPPRTCKKHDLASTVLDHGPHETQIGEVWGCNMAVRRGAITRYGGFREGMARSQEWEWQQRLLEGGGTIVYLPDAWLVHRWLADKTRLGALVRDAFRRGYFAGRRRPRRTAWQLGPRAAAALAHAGTRRCARGLTDASHRAGELCGTIPAVVRGRRSS